MDQKNPNFSIFLKFLQDYINPKISKNFQKDHKNPDFKQISMDQNYPNLKFFFMFPNFQQDYNNPKN